MAAHGMLQRQKVSENHVTDRPVEQTAGHRHGAADEALAGAPLTAALTRARWSIFWERLWPALAAIATVIGLFLAVSWLGLWLWLPPIGRAVGLFIFLLLAAAATVPLLLLRVPSVFEGLRRLDRTTGLPHRPATTIADEIASSPNDPVALALWHAHQEQARKAARTLRAGWPGPRLMARDPLALRAAVLVLLVATFFAAVASA